MKANYNNTESLLARFDKELKAILQYDLQQFKENKGKFLRNSVSKQQPVKRLLVA